MEHAAEDIALSNELGIRVMGYTDTVQFDDKLMQEAYGYTLEDLAVKQADGNYVFTKAWDPEGCYVACINKPKWRGLLSEINKLTAEAGFSSLMYDFYPYMAGGYFCHCSECEKLWKDYSREKLGEPKPMPVTFEFPDPVSVAYYKFRMESFADFMKGDRRRGKGRESGVFPAAEPQPEQLRRPLSAPARRPRPAHHRILGSGLRPGVGALPAAAGRSTGGGAALCVLQRRKPVYPFLPL